MGWERSVKISGKSAYIFYGWSLKILFFYQMTGTEKFSSVGVNRNPIKPE